MQILKTSIKIGIKKPIKFLHITDTHLPEYDENNPANAEERAKRKAFLKESFDYADKNDLTVIHTGDIMTFCNPDNLKFIDECFKNRDYIFAIGNHDFCKEGEYGDDPDNVERNISLVEPHFRSNLFFDSKIFNGELNVVSLSNGFFRITDAQLDALRTEVDKGLPILLCMHVPIFTHEHAKARMSIGDCAHLLGPSDDFLSKYPEIFAFHRADNTTLRAIDYIKNVSAIKAIVAGHTHMNYEETFENGLVQIVTGATFDKYIREITVY